MYLSFQEFNMHEHDYLKYDFVNYNMNYTAKLVHTLWGSDHQYYL